MKKIKKNMREQLTKIDPVIALLTANAAVNIGLIFLTGLLSRSDNNLTKIKAESINQTIPKASEVCSGFFDTGCYFQVEQEWCDGQNTLLNFKDDICEDRSIWEYNPTFLETIK